MKRKAGSFGARYWLSWIVTLAMTLSFMAVLPLFVSAATPNVYDVIAESKTFTAKSPYTLVAGMRPVPTKTYAYSKSGGPGTVAETTDIDGGNPSTMWKFYNGMLEEEGIPIDLSRSTYDPNNMYLVGYFEPLADKAPLNSLIFTMQGAGQEYTIAVSDAGAAFSHPEFAFIVPLEKFMTGSGTDTLKLSSLYADMHNRQITATGSGSIAAWSALSNMVVTVGSTKKFDGIYFHHISIVYFGDPGGKVDGPDLVIDSAALSNTYVANGSASTVTAAVKNQGNQPAAAGSQVTFSVGGFTETVACPQAIPAGGAVSVTTAGSVNLTAGATLTVNAEVFCSNEAPENAFNNKTAATAYITAADTAAGGGSLPKPGDNGRGWLAAPYTRYEAEEGTRANGAQLMGPSFVVSDIASEASNQQYIKLPSAGSSLSWKIREGEGGDGVTIRFTLNDSPDGMGTKGRVKVSVNGSPASISAYGTHFGDTITLDSYWSWQYFTGHSAHDTPGSGAPRFRFDEMHFRLAAPLKANDVIKFEKIEGGDEMGLDFIEIETVPAPIPKPTAGYVFDLSDPKYGGVTSNVGDNGADNIAKLNTLMEDARNRAKTNPNEVTVWIPEGKWNLGRGWALGAQNMKIMGAGMWYTNLHFTSSLDWNGGISGEINKNNRCDNFWDPKPQNGQNLHSTNLDFGHMYLSSMLRSRYGEEAVYKCFMDSFGSNSRIHNIWEEHFECGFWIADYNGNIVQTDYLTIEDSRLRNNLADAVNFCRGTQYSTVKNCSVRGNGDDALAMWNDSSQRDQVGNAFLNNTIENNWRAAAIGIFGGDAHRIENNYIKDCFKSAAIRVNTTFPGFKFNNTNNISFKNNTIISSGTSHNCYDYVQGAIDFEGGGVKNITFENTDIYNSQRYAVRFFRQHSNITFTNTTVDTIWADGDMHKGTGEQPCNVNELSPGCKVVFSHENQTNIVFNGLAVKNVQGNPRLAALKDEYKTINNVPSASDDFLRNTSNGFTLNNVTWPSGTAVPETTALSLGPVNFGIMDMGYAAPPAQRTVSIRNTGSGAAAIAQVSVSNTGAFAVTALDATAIASCAVNTSLKIQPKPGLPAGKHTATITVLYNNGRVSTAEVKFIVEGVNPPSAPTITTSSLADGVKGAAYSASLAATASGGGQITWSISGANTLTAYGLALNPNGAISGTPTAAGLVTFSVVATNDIGASAPKQLTINIIDPALQPPVVLSVTPAGAGAPVNGQIAITFSKPMDPAAGTVRLNALPALTGGVWSGNTVFTIPYSGLANSTVYTVNISGFKDTAGQAMTPNSTHGFTTAETNPNNRTAPGTIFASTYDETNGARLDIQNCSDLPGNGYNIGNIDGGNWVCYKNVDVVAAIGGATFRAAKDVGTMTIELRLGGPDGQLLAAAEVKGTQDHNDGVKGDQDWWTYYTYEATFTGVLPLGRHDIYLVFSGSVNLSWFSLNADTTVIPTVIYGDVNGSGSVDIGDARMVLQHLVGKLTLTPEQLAVANVSGGDQLSISDARLILQYLVDKIDTFPAEK